MFDYDNRSKKTVKMLRIPQIKVDRRSFVRLTFLNLQILHFLSKEFCQSRLRDPSKVSLASRGFIDWH
jgi:hypothetical protein